MEGGRRTFLGKTVAESRLAVDKGKQAEGEDGAEVLASSIPCDISTVNTI